MPQDSAAKATGRASRHCGAETAEIGLLEKLAAAEAARDEALADAAEAERRRRRFIAAAVHDLRQPLGAARLLLDALPDAAPGIERDAMVSRIAAAITSADALAAALPELARRDSGEAAPACSPLPLLGVFEAIRAEFEGAAAAKGLSLDARDRGLGVRADAALLGRVLRNLVANSVRCTESGRVEMSASLRDGEVVVEVADTGPGMSAAARREAIARLSGHEMQGSARDGERLGLAIVGRACALMGTQARLETSPDRGVRVRLSLPGA